MFVFQTFLFTVSDRKFLLSRPRSIWLYPNTCSRINQFSLRGGMNRATCKEGNFEERVNMLALVIWFLLFVASFQRVSTADDCSGTQIHNSRKCEVQYKQVQRSPTFQIGEKTILDTYVVHETLSSRNVTEECSLTLNVEDALKESVQKSKRSSAIVQVRILCENPARVSFCRPENFTANYLILYLIFQKQCRVTGADMAVWGRATDLRVLYLMDDVIFQDNNETTAELDGLFNIGTLVLDNLKSKSIPSMFLDHVWEKIAEVQLSKMHLGSSLNILKTTMPYLQSLELSRNNITTLPDFPWCNRSLELPRNLSRTFILNEHYSEEMALIPSTYRRFLVVHFNPEIRNLKISPGRLDKISLRGNNLKFLNSTIFDGIKGLRAIDLSFNLLSNIPEGIFDKTPGLISVNLANNNLTRLSGKTFENLLNLRKLDASSNSIQILRNGFLSDKQKSVEVINFERNLLRVVEAKAFPRGVFNSLKEINLRKNKLRVVPQIGLYVRNLKTYDVSENEINFAGFVKTLDEIFLNDLLYVHTSIASSIETRVPKKASINSESTKKILNLEGNAIERFDLTKFSETRLTNLMFMLKFFKILLTGNRLHCDCKTSQLQKRIVSWTNISSGITVNDFESWKCHTPDELRGMKVLDVPPKALRCETRCSKCPRRCTCYRSDSDARTLVDCRSRNLTELPEELPNGIVELRLEHNQIEKLTLSKNIENVSVLYASHNQLQRVYLNHNAPKLKEIYLDSNKLTTLPQDFQNLSVSRIDLRYNYFKCDCENYWVKAWLKKRRNTLVGGAQSVACSSGYRNLGKPLVSLEDGDFICTTSGGHTTNESIKTISSYVLASFLFMVLVLVALIYRFRKEIKLILYTRFNWHPFDRVDDSDPSKIYDAFVSFNMRDRQWVMDTLQNKLENHNPPYKLCIHCRDFIPGAPIAENILENVKKSRRMIMVLSRNFIQSEWCMLEFRAAHRRVLRGRRNYLIIVLFDDVNIDSLDDELKLYLKTNTYLNEQSKWFWQQLKYALPQKKPDGQ